MNIKDIIFELANAYVEHYKREDRIYKALEAERIYVDIANDPYTSAIEEIFKNITGGIDFASALCEFAANGSVHLKPNKLSPWEDVDDLKRIIDIYMDDLTN